MNYRIAHSIYLTMVHLGYNKDWALVWATMALDCLMSEENSLIVDMLKGGE